MPVREPDRCRLGEGITEESSEASAVSCIHAIPPPLRPAVPGMFNLINSAMRWASLVYVPASTAEMLISGLELILSTVAARVIRKRMISMQRWGGVCIVAMGLVVVRLSEISPASDDADANGDLMFSNVTVNDDDNVAEGAGVDNENAASASATTSSIQTTERLIGDILIVGQCIMSVLQDLAEELFMHEAELSPTLLLGWEGVFGLVFGLPLYLPLAPLLGEDPNEVWELLKSSTWVLAYVSGLVLLFTATGVFNIVATAVMSSMTRNIWKNFRSLAVWILGLCLYYSSGNESSIGERWKIPASFVTLLGFATMLGGICLYYRTPEARTLDSGCQWGRKRYSAVNIVVDDEEAPNGCDSSIELVQPTTMLHAGTN
jgi:drug/metabolite transporter (DMT)-like permease